MQTSHTSANDDKRERARGSDPEMDSRKARDFLQDADWRLRVLVDDHPFAAVFGALGLGYLIGRMIRR